MPLTKEQLAELRQQLKEQTKNLPPEKKAEAEAHINSMSPESLELMLSQQQKQQIFRLIAEKKIESVVISENSDAIGVLEINPISIGHVLIIPKQEITDPSVITQKTKDLQKEIADKIKAQLSPKDIKIIAEKKFGEIIINIIPEYDAPVSIDSERKPAQKEALQEIAKKINTQIIKTEKKIEVIKTEKKDSEEKPIIRKRRIA